MPHAAANPAVPGQVAARRRIAELEERLQRLQLLKTKLSRMKANADDTMQRKDATFGATQSVHFSLPGETQPHHKHNLSPHRTLQATNAASGAQWATVEEMDGDPDSPTRNDEEADDEVPSGAHTRMAAYLPPYQPGMVPPFTPGMSGLRKIIRDEMTSVIDLVVNDRMLKSKEVDAESEALILPPESSPSHADRPRTSTRQAWTAKTGDSEFPPEIESSLDETIKQDVVLMPRTLDEAELRSVPWLFGGLTRQSPLRIKCFAIMNSGSWGGIFYTSTLFSCVYVAVVVEMPGWTDADRSMVFDVAEYVFTGIFALEILVGILALGFIRGKTSWIRISGINGLDFLIMIAIIIEQVLVGIGYSGITVRAFRIVRMLKMLMYFKGFSGVRNIVSTLTTGAAQLITVFFVLLFFLAAVSTLLLTFLRHSFSRRCVVIDQKLGSCVADASTGWKSPDTCDFKNWQHTASILKGFTTPDDLFPVMIDDFYPFERWCKIEANATAGQYDDNPKYDLDFKGRYHTCGRGRPNYRKGSEMCVEVGNPSSGFSHFDDVGGALVSLAQGAAPDSYYDIVWRSIESEPSAIPVFVILYFFLTLMSTWLLLGIFVAVVTGTYQVVRTKQKEEEEEYQARRDALELQQFEALGFGKHNFWESERTRHQNHVRLVERLVETRNQKSSV